jgi:hypothetical protein
MRTPSILACAAGLATSASAQEQFVVNSSWVEVIAGSITPVPSPNSILEPGEAARIRIATEARINGSNAVGQTTTYSIPVPGGVGTVRGLGLLSYDLVGDSGGASANGTWGGFFGGLAGPIPGVPFTGLLTGGTPQPGGSSVFEFGGLQSFLAPASANAHNSNVQAFRGVWQPASYASRSVTFLPRGSIFVPAGEHNSILVAYGVGTDSNTGENFDLLQSKFIPTNFGNGVQIPIVPGPASLLPLLAGAVIASRRRKPPLTR